jgi:hypothetical protein
MAKIVLRVRFVSGDHIDIVYEESDTDDDVVAEHAISILTDDSGVLRTRHGDRLFAVFARGVAAVEVAPRGAVL